MNDKIPLVMVGDTALKISTQGHQEPFHYGVLKKKKKSHANSKTFVLKKHEYVQQFFKHVSKKAFQ